MVSGTSDDSDSDDHGIEFALDDNEPIMEESDDEFGEFDNELRDQLEVDEMEDEKVVEECIVSGTDLGTCMSDGGGENAKWPE